MKKTSFISVGLFFLFGYFAMSCQGGNTKAEQATATAPNLATVTASLPEAAGYQVFKTNCTICHSANYVDMQPDFPEKTWAGIVAKMKNVYGAPVSDSSAAVIVQYLTTIKGEKKSHVPNAAPPS